MMLTVQAVEQENVRILAAEKAERDKRVIALLNQLPINLSAERIVDERYADVVPREGLHFIRLLVCAAADDEDIGENDPVYWDLQQLLEMDADDAVDFMFQLHADIGVDGDAGDLVYGDDLKTQVMVAVYGWLPLHLRECMQGAFACGAYDD